MKPIRSMVVAAASVALVVIAAVPAAAAPHSKKAEQPDSAGALRHAALTNTLTRNHKVLDNCTVTNGGKTVRLCNVGLIAAAGSSSKPLTTAAPATLTPDDLARAYHLPSDPGKAGVVGVVGFGGTPHLAADLAVYRAKYHLPACTEANGCLKIVGQYGGRPPAPLGVPLLNKIDEGLNLETTLDVEMVSAACPRCQIRMVELPDAPILPQYAYLPSVTASTMADGVDTALKLGANAVTMSYALGNGIQPGIATGNLAQRMHHPGIAMVASSGDWGLVTDPKLEYWPQELPWVTSVGGVQLASADGGKSFTKKAWFHGDYSPTMAASSACSTVVGPANGQPSAIAANCGGKRASSDVSATSYNLSIYDTYLPATGGNGGWGVAVGTSASAPYVAGLYARAGTDGVDGPNTIYAAGKGALEDVTDGSNMANGAADCAKAKLPASLCVSGKGWDGPTGLGVPHGLGAF